MNDDLKPCPFCAIPAEYNKYHDCPRCGNEDCLVDAHATVGTTEQKIQRWNTRPIEDALLARAEAADAKCEERTRAMHYANKVAMEYKHRAESIERELAALRERTRWIPVSERLPDKDCYCLVAKGEAISLGYFIDGIFRYSPMHYLNLDAFPVTHWILLPDQPESA